MRASFAASSSSLAAATGAGTSSMRAGVSKPANEESSNWRSSWSICAVIASISSATCSRNTSTSSTS